MTLPWGTRLKIAVGAAKGLAFLHGADQPVIYRDFKTSNVLIDSVCNILLCTCSFYFLGVELLFGKFCMLICLNLLLFLY